MTHYAGHVRIVRGRTVTTINHPARGGTPVCGNTSPNASWVVSRKSAMNPITCKRCLRLLAEHDRAAGEP